MPSTSVVECAVAFTGMMCDWLGVLILQPRHSTSSCSLLATNECGGTLRLALSARPHQPPVALTGIIMPNGFEAQTAKAECLCGLLQPSRPHLTWNCERTASTRPNLALPVDRCEERLFARPRREIPKPPIVLDVEGFVVELSEALQAGFSARRNRRCCNRR